MLSEEEKKAVESLKGMDIKFFLSGMMEQSNYIVNKADEVNKHIETLLNLIEKQSKEIEEYKNKYEQLKLIEIERHIPRID